MPDDSAYAANRPTEQKMRVSESFEGKINAVRGERKKAGRPLGSKNKPRGIMPKDVAHEFLGVLKDIVPTSYYEEMSKAIREGKTVATVTEAKVTLALLGPAIWNRLIDEAKPNADGSHKPFSRDLNERLKVYTSLMTFIEKVDDGPDRDTQTQPLLELFARSGPDGERLDALIGIKFGHLGRDDDGTRGQETPARAISGELAERSIDLQDSVQVETDWLLDHDIARDGSFSVREEELQG